MIWRNPFCSFEIWPCRGGWLVNKLMRARRWNNDVIFCNILFFCKLRLNNYNSHKCIFLESIIIVWFNVLQHSRTCLPRSKSSKRIDCYQHMYSKCYFLLFFEPSNRRFARKAGTSSMRQTVDLGRTTSSNYCRCAKTL